MSNKSSSTEVIPFDYQSIQIRTIKRDDGLAWFVAKDVCDVLGLVNARKAVSVLDDDEKNTVTLSDGNRGNPNVNVINESGLYTLILRSNKPEAKPFRKWVTSEVLPAIRKTGTYTMPKPATLTPAQQREVQRLVSEKAIAASGNEKPGRHEFIKIYRSIKDYFQVAKYSQVPQERFDELVEFLDGTGRNLTPALPNQLSMAALREIIKEEVEKALTVANNHSEREIVDVVRKLPDRDMAGLWHMLRKMQAKQGCILFYRPDLPKPWRDHDTGETF